jgi:hypothetical protein
LRNDGYLLQYFAERGIPVLGIEPARNVAEVAKQKGVPTEVVFFGTQTAKRLASEGKYADLLLGNNVLAHVPDLNDFVKGLKILLKQQGMITMEFPHLMKLMEEAQFDTIYHEHFSYFSLLTVEKIFHAHGLTLFDVEELSTHGGSLRIYARHTEDKTKPITERVDQLKQKEIETGYSDIRHYLGFQERVKTIKKNILKFFIQAKEERKSCDWALLRGHIAGYCGIRTDFIDYTVDEIRISKDIFWGPYTVEEPNKVKETKPDYYSFART